MDGEKPRVLVVDDESDTLLYLFDLLSQEGYEVLGLSSAPDALDHARRRRYDVVLSDVRMPEMDGLELAGRIKTVSPGSRVILFSAFVDDAMRVEAFRKGAEHLLQKPFRGEELLRALGRVAQGTA